MKGGTMGSKKAKGKKPAPKKSAAKPKKKK
jgi:hypothetical protein